jgi:hypothetical protein
MHELRAESAGLARPTRIALFSSLSRSARAQHPLREPEGQTLLADPGGAVQQEAGRQGPTVKGAGES